MTGTAETRVWKVVWTGVVILAFGQGCILYNAQLQQKLFSAVSERIGAPSPEWAVLEGAISQLRTRGGRLRYINTATNTFGAALLFAFGVAAVRCLQKQRRVQMALSESESRLSLADAMPLLGWIADAKGRSVWFNESWHRYAGTKQEESPNIDWLSFVEPAQEPEAKRLWRDALRDCTPFEMHLLMRRHDGAYRYFLTRIVPIKASQPDMPQWLGTGVDAHELKCTEEKLRLSVERFQMLGQATNDALWDWNLQTGGLWWSDNFYSIFGYDRSEVEPGIESWEKRIHPEEVGAVVDSIHRCLESTQGKWTHEYRFLRKDGAYAEVLDRGYVQHDAAGVPVRMIGAMMDVTERKHVEAEVLMLNRELEQRVRQRTQEMESANKALEAFSYSVSHDLRAPLRHITGFVQLLQRTNGERLDETGRRYVGIILDAAEKMGRLIDALLAFSRLGRETLKMTAVDMNLLVAEVQRDLAPECQGRQVSWRVGRLPVVQADPVLMRQVLLNLLENALKYTRPREIAQIELSAEESAREFVFSLKDNGVGFDIKYAGKLFGVFQRLHSESEFEGTGVGLANVQRIISLHGGRVGAQAVEGEGAVFSFSVPKAQVPPGGRGMDAVAKPYDSIETHTTR